MITRSGTIVVEFDSEEGALVRRALAAEQRVNLLKLLTNRAMNVNEIATTLGVSQPTASVHIRMLEEAGLVECEYTSVGRGSEKRCWTTFDKIIFEATPTPPKGTDLSEETMMPVGLYTAISVTPTCGLASSERVIGLLDQKQSFLLPERSEAQLLWFSRGWVEYTFPCTIPSSAEVTSLEFSAELCSEAPGYDNEWPSDITVWINGMEIGTWTSPGDFGGRRGRLNPEWWSDRASQFGCLKSWSVNGTGSRIDGVTASNTRVSDLGLGYEKSIVVRIGNKPDAEHIGGLSLFGRQFGNYPQDLVLRVTYKIKSRQADELSKSVEDQPENELIELSTES